MKRFTAIGMIALAAIALSACGLMVNIPTEPIKRDPTWLALGIYNESPYELHMEGLTRETIGPHSALFLNMKCRGRFNGVAHAWKTIGQSDSGKYSETAYMGENVFALYLDGHNYVYRDKSLDAWIEFNEWSFRTYPNVLGEKHHILYQPPCSIGIVPHVEFELGK